MISQLVNCNAIFGSQTSVFHPYFQISLIVGLYHCFLPIDYNCSRRSAVRRPWEAMHLFSLFTFEKNTLWTYYFFRTYHIHLTNLTPFEREHEESYEFFHLPFPKATVMQLFMRIHFHCIPIFYFLLHRHLLLLKYQNVVFKTSDLLVTFLYSTLRIFWGYVRCTKCLLIASLFFFIVVLISARSNVWS